MTLHTHFCQITTLTAAGKAGTWISPSSDQFISPYDNADYADIIALMATISTQTRETYIKFNIPQDPAFIEQEIQPDVLNNTLTNIGDLVYPVGNYRQRINRKMVATGYDAAGGALVAGLGVLTRYGAPLPALDWERPPSGLIRHRIHLDSDLTADTWTEIGVDTDLDPDHDYGLVAMRAMPEDSVCIGVRANLKSTGCKPGVTPGPEVRFPEIAAVFRGDSRPTFEGYVDAAGELELIVTYLDLGSRTGGGSNVTVGGFEPKPKSQFSLF